MASTTASERDPLLIPYPTESYDAEDERSDQTSIASLFPENRALIWQLYISQFLLRWNSRLFEFAAVLYAAVLYPDTLMPLSVYALVRGLAVVVFSSKVGWFVDNGNRLTTVINSIIIQRITAAISCVLFYFLSTKSVRKDLRAQIWVMGVLIVLACFEKLAAVLCRIAVTRDWVVEIGKSQTVVRSTKSSGIWLTEMNAELRRIDLITKMIGPFFISVLISISVEMAMAANFAMNIISVPIEIWALTRVYQQVPELSERAYRQRQDSADTTYEDESEAERLIPSAPKSPRVRSNWYRFQKTLGLAKFAADLHHFFTHPILLPAASSAFVLYSILNLAGQLIVYLMSAGISAREVGTAKMLGVITELSSTWIAPQLIYRIGIVRTGAWLSVAQAVPLVAGVVAYLVYEGNAPRSAALALLVTIPISRVGLRGAEMCHEQIVQEGVEPEARGSFSAMESGLRNLFEIISFAFTIVYWSVEDIKIPILVSAGSDVMAAVCFVAFNIIYKGKMPQVF